MATAHLVTQAYGSPAIRAQALYLTWSALAWRQHADFAFHVYTDAPEAFAPVAREVEVRAMSAAEIAEWRGRHDFTHRLKAVLVRDLVRRFPSEPLLYLDADMYFQGPVGQVLSRIGPGRSVMHAREELVSDPHDRHMRNFSGHLRRLSFRGGPIDVERYMWNAGVVGIHPSAFGVADDWVAFIDEVWPRYRRGLVEQYGIAMLLQRAGEVSPCADVICHYWYQKDEYAPEVVRETARLRTAPLAEALAQVRERPVRFPYRPRAKAHTPIWARMRRSLLGER